MKKTIAIVGTGPAGIAASWAVAMMGHPVILFGDSDQPSEIAGAQYLHRPLPDIEGNLPDPDFSITYQKMGTKEVYQDKVYKGVDIPFSSWGGFGFATPIPAWSLRERYEQLWQMLTKNGASINMAKVGKEELQQLFDDSIVGGVVIAIPRHHICKKRNKGHLFESVNVSLAQGRYYETPANTIIYNGDPDYSWARSSNIDGQRWTEWGYGGRPPVDEDALNTVVKPVATNCDCWSEEISSGDLLFAGRAAHWEKGKLVDSAFYETCHAL
jgi:hypothetical protein